MIKFMMWLCPNCGRTVHCPNPSTYMPNTTCECEYPKFAVQMVRVWPPISPDSNPRQSKEKTNVEQIRVSPATTREEAIGDIISNLKYAYNIASRQNSITFDEYTTLEVFVKYYAKLLGVKNVINDKEDE